MVALDESNIELTWECPPCHKKSHPEPEPDLEPPQQTVAKLPKPTPTPSEAISAPVTPPVTPKTPVTPIMPVNHKPAQVWRHEYGVGVSFTTDDTSVIVRPIMLSDHVITSLKKT